MAEQQPGAVDDLTRLTRFLCLGDEGGTYNAGEPQLPTSEKAQCITRLIAAGRGCEVVQTIIDFSDTGRTAKQDGLMFAMAMCARQWHDSETKKMCYANLHLVCRIPTHLFAFIDYCEKLSTEGTGWGRAHRKAIVYWYKHFGETSERAMRLAMLVTKYRKRNGWSHLDILRLAHPKPNDDNADNGVTAIFKYIVNGFDAAKDHLLKSNGNSALLAYLQAVEDVKSHKDPAMLDVTGLADVIKQHRLTREHVNTTLLVFPAIWTALLENMPMTAMIRNLGKMTAMGMLSPDSDNEGIIVSRFQNIDALEKAKIHPFNLLVALFKYKDGRNSNTAVVDALGLAFYQTFQFVQPTNKRYLLALNVSPSMVAGSVNGSRSVRPRMAAAALALVTAATETHCDIVGLSNPMAPLPVKHNMRLTEFERAMQGMQAGRTDCSLPMVYAREQRRHYDVFVIYTDNVPGNQNTSVREALQQYRQSSGIKDAKLIVVALASNGFCIADPDDCNMMDIAGFDTRAPEIMKDFVGGTMKAGHVVH